MTPISGALVIYPKHSSSRDAPGPCTGSSHCWDVRHRNLPLTDLLRAPLLLEGATAPASPFPPTPRPPRLLAPP